VISMVRRMNGGVLVVEKQGVILIRVVIGVIVPVWSLAVRGVRLAVR
jgi:hypothetical protein